MARIACAAARVVAGCRATQDGRCRGRRIARAGPQLGERIVLKKLVLSRSHDCEDARWHDTPPAQMLQSQEQAKLSAMND